MRKGTSRASPDGFRCVAEAVLTTLFATAALLAGPAPGPPAGGLAPAVPEARGAVLDRGLSATPVSAAGGVLAWSRQDPRTRRWVLVARREKRTEVLPVGSRGAPFDLDAGPGPDRAPTLVYSRCVVERGVDEVGERFAGEGCRIFSFSFATRQERPVARTHRDSSSEQLPAVWGGRVAFFRTALDGTGPSRLFVVDGAGREERRPVGPAAGPPAALDLRGRTTAALTRAAGEELGGAVSRLVVQATAGAPVRSVDQGFFGEECAIEPLAPVLGDRELRWVSRSTSVYANPCRNEANVLRRLPLGSSERPEPVAALGDAPVAAAPLPEGRFAVLAPRAGTAGGESHEPCASDRARGLDHCELRVVG